MWSGWRAIDKSSQIINLGEEVYLKGEFSSFSSGTYSASPKVKVNTWHRKQELSKRSFINVNV